jgi:apolipoprotein D and lipocalin family protein
LTISRNKNRFNQKAHYLKKISILLFTFLIGCTGIPENIKPVNNFNLEKYLGTWYEIARLDHSFERGLSHVTADYTLRNDGGVNVINRGYSAEKGSWKEAEGEAYFMEEPDLGYFKVSFFGPFYGSYIIFELDQEGYQYSLVCGADKSYLWILGRNPTIKKEIKSALLEKAAEVGFDISRLIFVNHENLPEG